MPNELLRAARLCTPSRQIPGECMSPREVAESVNAWLWHATGKRYDLDAHSVARWERGSVRWPLAAYRAALRAVLRVDSDAALGFTPTRRSASLVDLAGAQDTAERDRLVQAAHNPARVDQVTLDTVAGVLSATRRLEDTIGAAAVLPTVAAQRHLVERFACGGRGTHRRRAVGMLSELHQYLGWLAVPLQQWADAGRHLDRAAVLAVETGDPDLLANALSFNAYRLIHTGDLVAAESLSEAARRDDRVTPALIAYEMYQGAEIAARLGDRAAAGRLLTDADRAVGRMPADPDLPDHGYWNTAPFLYGQAAFTLRELGDLTTARRVAEDCLATLPGDWARSEWAHPWRELAADT